MRRAATSGQRGDTMASRLKRRSRGSPAKPRPPKAPNPVAVTLVESPEPRSDAFAVVGIGASAGGLEAFTRLLKALPGDTGMAFVLIQHLDPKHPSLLSEILSRASALPVTSAADDMAVEPNHVYVMPENADMEIDQGILRLARREGDKGHHLPIDGFLKSLARDQRGRAIGVILSGTASDGVVGLRAIKAEGGITFAQAEQSAKFGSMPHSAIAAGVVDLVLPPEEIATELGRIARHPYVRSHDAIPEAPVDQHGDALAAIFKALHASTGVDFAEYKQSTIQRRIRRRMVVHRMDRLEDYADYLKLKPGEVQVLYDDILINVTGFFRDPGAFEALRSSVFPVFLKQDSARGSLRIWVPGCATGEEAYSIAIALLEFLGDRAVGVPIQIFATDIDETAIETARSGVYRDSIAADLTPDRLRRFFIKVERGYQVTKSVRDMCVFAKQNVTRDPPFSRLDLISCRNVLIYLGPVLQRLVMPIFHYALKSTGFLLLGTAETVGAFSDLFEAVDRKHRIYARKLTAGRLGVEFAPSESTRASIEVAGGRAEAAPGMQDVHREADRIALTRYAPPGVLVNDEMEILQFRGQTGKYLEPAPGQASLNLMKMAKEGLALELRAALHRVKKGGVSVRVDRLQVRRDGRRETVSLEVAPLRLRNGTQRFYLVTFEESARVAPAGARHRGARQQGEGAATEESERIEIKNELASTKEYLQSIIEEQEATNEELRSANEEILSSNEELQSTNEELETSKEELQSTNEELTTVNEELHNRNVELSQITNDLLNVLGSVNISMVMLGPDLRIRRLTAGAEKTLGLIPGDIGRRITDVRTLLPAPDLEQLVLDSIESMSARERTVQDRDGRWFAMRVCPYRTADNRVDGAVLVLLDIDDLKRSSQELQDSRDFAAAIVDTMRGALLVLDADLRIKKANRSFYETFRVSPAETEERLVSEIGGGQWNLARLLSPLRNVVQQGTRLEDLELAIDIPEIGPNLVLINARRLERESGSPPMVLLSLWDISRRERAETAVAELSGRLLRLRDEEQRRIARELHDSTAQNLSALLMSLALVDRVAGSLTSEARKALSDSIVLAEQCSSEIRDIASLLHPPLLDEVGLASALQWYAEFFTRRTGIRVDLEISPELGRLAPEAETMMFRIVQECLTNVQRHSGSPTATVRISRDPTAAMLEIADQGRGMPAQGDGSPGEKASRGVGIAGMTERARQFGGTLEVVSSDAGTLVRAVLPVAEHES